MQKAADVRAPQREEVFLKTCFGYANDPCSANGTAAQLQLRKGYCLKHAQNRWRYGLLHRRTALNVFMVIQGGFKHELHAFAVAGAPTAPTPTIQSLAE